MHKVRGLVLVMSLLLLLMMALILSASLFVSQLSQKSAQAGQQQFVLSAQARSEHLAAVSAPDPAAEGEEAAAYGSCPAQYAAWSGTQLRCRTVLISTQTFSADKHFFSGYTSVLLRQTLQSEDLADDLR